MATRQEVEDVKARQLPNPADYSTVLYIMALVLHCWIVRKFAQAGMLAGYNLLRDDTTPVLCNLPAKRASTK